MECQPPPPQRSPGLSRHVKMICRSFERLVGQPLLTNLPSEEFELVEVIWQAPIVVVSHDTAKDPRFNYGNLCALRLWEMTWGEFVGLPSRYSAESAHREERARLLQEVSEHGFSERYSGIRASKNGRRFRIENATVFNLIDETEKISGQAAVFSGWTHL